VNVVGKLQRKRTLAASRGFLAAARLSCLLLLLIFGIQPELGIFHHSAFRPFGIRASPRQYRHQRTVRQRLRNFCINKNKMIA